MPMRTLTFIIAILALFVATPALEAAPQHGNISIALGVAGGGYQTPLEYQLGDWARLSAPGQVNTTDAYVDIVASYEEIVGASTQSYITALLGRGDGSFTRTPRVTVGAAGEEVYLLFLKNVVGGPALDLIAYVGMSSNAPSVTIYTFEGFGDGTFGIPTLSTGALPGVAVGEWLVDLNGDGIPDQVTVNRLRDDLSTLTDVATADPPLPGTLLVRASPPGGNYTSTQGITLGPNIDDLDGDGTNVVLYYTLDGSTPNPATSPSIPYPYRKQIFIIQNITLKFMGKDPSTG